MIAGKGKVVPVLN